MSYYGRSSIGYAHSRQGALIFGTLAVVLAISPAAAETCPGPDTQIIRDSYFNLTYESWVRPPAVGGSTFSFGRCVSSANRLSTKIDWKKAQLVGTATPNIPLFATFPFIDGRAIETASEFRYGIDNPPKEKKIVNFRANLQEIEPGKSQEANRGAFEKLRSAAQIGAAMSHDLANATSLAQIPIVDEKGEAALVLKTVFVSSLSAVDSGFGYKFTYDINLLGSSGDRIAKTLAIKPNSSILAASLRAKFDKVAINLRPEGGVVIFQSFPSKSLTMSVARMDVISENEVIAAFPVSYFGPIDNKLQ
jgi:hypothetical protein